MYLATLDVKENGVCDNEVTFCEANLICSRCPDSMGDSKCIRDGKSTIRVISTTTFYILTLIK